MMRLDFYLLLIASFSMKLVGKFRTKNFIKTGILSAFMS